MSYYDRYKKLSDSIREESGTKEDAEEYGALKSRLYSYNTGEDILRGLLAKLTYSSLAKPGSGAEKNFIENILSKAESIKKDRVYKEFTGYSKYVADVTSAVGTYSSIMARMLRDEVGFSSETYNEYTPYFESRIEIDENMYLVYVDVYFTQSTGMHKTLLIEVDA